MRTRCAADTFGCHTLETVSKGFLSLAILLSLSLYAWGGEKTWTGGSSADWNTPANWNPSGVPGTADRATIPIVTRFPVISNNPPNAINQLRVLAGATLTINNSRTLTITNTTLSPVIDGAGTVVTAGSGLVTVTGGVNSGILINDAITLGNFTLNATANRNMGIASGIGVVFNGNVTVQSSEIQVGAANGAPTTVDINGTLTVAGTLAMRSAGSVLRLSGNWTQTGVWTPGTSTVVLDGTAAQTINLNAGGPYSFYDLVVNTSSNTTNQVDGQLVTMTAAFTVLNNLSLTRGQFQLGAFTVDVLGNIDSGLETQSQLDFSAAGTLRARGNVDLGAFSQVTTQTQGPFSTIIMNGTTPQTFRIRAATGSEYHDLDNFRVSNLAGVTILDNPNANFVVNGTLTLDANCGMTIQDTFQADGPIVFAAGGGNVLRLEGDILYDGTPLGSSFTSGTGTVVFAGRGVSQIVSTTSGTSTPISYYNLTIDNTTGTVATQQAGNLLRIAGSFTVQTANATFAATTGNMTVSQDFIDNGQFNAGTFTVTLNGTGTIGGTAASLQFNNLLVSGATTSIVTAARSFTTNSTFQITQGTLTTLGVSSPVTMTAAQGLTVGDGTGAAGSAALNLVGPATIAIATTKVFSVLAADGRVTSTATSDGIPTLTRNGASGTFTATVNGQVNLVGLNFSFGDASGLNLTATATIEGLRNVRFTNMNAAAGSRHLTVTSAGIDLDCPGCFFDTVAAGSFNVWAVDSNVGNNIPVRLRFEDRTRASSVGAIGGPGAGETWDGDDDTNDNGVIDGGETTSLHGGAIIQWVYTANVDLSGAIQGFPMPAFDWNTGVYYATYVVMRQGVGPDTIYRLNPEGDLIPGASFIPPGTGNGNIVGPLFWDTEGSTHVVYFGTTTGRVYKLIDTGSALVMPSPPSPWSTYFSDTRLTSVTSWIISDQLNLLFGGFVVFSGNTTNGIFRIQISDKTMPLPMLSTTTRTITTAPSWADTPSGRRLFLASNAVSSVSNIYRVNVPNWIIDANVFSTTAFVAPTNVATDTLFVGELSGRMHALPALGTPAQFMVERTGFPFTSNTSPVTGGAVWDWVNQSRLPLNGGRLFFGTGAGDLYTLYLYPSTWALGSNYYRNSTPGGNAIQTMPLAQDGVVYVANSRGSLFIFDADAGAGPVLLRTYTLFGAAASGDISRDSLGSGRLYVGTAAGRVYAIPPPSDPTPQFP